MTTTSSPLRLGAAGAAKYYQIFAYYCGGPRTTVGVRGPLAARWGISELTWDEWGQLYLGRSRDGSRRLVQVGYRVLRDEVRDPVTGRTTFVDRRDPVTGKRLTEPAHTGLIDVVYAAPKSVVELLMRLEGHLVLQEQIKEAFRQAVLEAHGSLEDHAEVCRVSVQTPKQAGECIIGRGPRRGQRSRQQGSVTRRVPAELLSLEPIINYIARPTEETRARGLPDPHLHAHVPIIAVAAVVDPNRPDGVRYLTPDDAGIKAQAAERDALFLGALARHLQELGIPLCFDEDRPGHITWEIDGSDPELCWFFSSNRRRAQALRRTHEEAEGRPLPHPVEQARMRASRQSKDAQAKRLDVHPDWEAWAALARRAGFDVSPYQPQLAPIEQAPLVEREATLRARLLGPKGLERDGLTLSRAEIRAAVARCAVDLGLSRDHLEAFAEALGSELKVVRADPDPRNERLRVPTELRVRAGRAMPSEESVAGVELPAIDVPPLELTPLDEEALAAASSALWTTTALATRADRRSASTNRRPPSDLGLGRELSR